MQCMSMREHSYSLETGYGEMFLEFILDGHSGLYWSQFRLYGERVNVYLTTLYSR